MTALTPSTFLPDATRRILDQACRSNRLDSDGAELLRHQTNATYLLPRPGIIVKILRPDTSLAQVIDELNLLRVLKEAGYPTVQPLPLTAQPPEVIAGCPITFWPYVAQDHARPVNAAELGSRLRRLHSLPPLPTELPPLDAFRAIRASIAATEILDEPEASLLLRRADILESAWQTIEWELGQGLIHGDPHHVNALRQGGEAILIDWESAAFGPYEWDIATVEVHLRRFRYPASDYESFVKTYGFDLRTWPGWETMRAVRELRMIATNARKSPPDSHAAAEVLRRIGEIREGRHHASWHRL